MSAYFYIDNMYIYIYIYMSVYAIYMYPTYKLCRYPISNFVFRSNCSTYLRCTLRIVLFGSPSISVRYEDKAIPVTGREGP
jgi:hypothetical protein